MNLISLEGIRAIFERNLTVETIKEEIAYLADDLSVNETIAYLKSRAFDVVGVKSKEDIHL